MASTLSHSDAKGHGLSQRARLAGGQPISYLMAQALARPELISLAAGFVDQATLPVQETAAAAGKLLSNEVAAREALQYGTTAGYAPLRDALLDALRQSDHDPASERDLSIEQVVLTAGSNQLLHLVGESLLDPGDIVLCAAPTYFVFLGTISNQGARSVGVESDEQGIVPEALENELARLEMADELHRVKAIYVTSYFDNPGSVSLSEARRPEIVAIARRWSRERPIYVIEDAAYRELRYDCEDIPSLRSFDEEGDTVVYAGTFSKSFSPGIRVGWGILPEQLVDPILDQKGNHDFGSPNFAQHLMYRVLEEGLFENHIALLRESYQKKMHAMLDAANEHLAPLEGVRWHVPSGGLYVWVTLPEHVNAGPTGELFDRALEAGVLYVPGEYCYPKEGERKHNTIRLSFGVQPVENIRKGIEALAQAIASI